MAQYLSHIPFVGAVPVMRARFRDAGKELCQFAELIFQQNVDIVIASLIDVGEVIRRSFASPGTPFHKLSLSLVFRAALSRLQQYMFVVPIM